MVTLKPRFWDGPIRYLRWACRERPAYYWAVVIGGLGPVTLATVPPAMKAAGYKRAPPIPMTYPIPPGPRKQLTGYDD
ncbi:n19m, NADH-ubiquinone oxidoreductase 9.5 kDa subunit [Diatrype stigma]|uniref:N19m, NADH-ubiquinone oxidoreductase 9.5 kDa subunit n=1 Tax=Diatrype stigma TaxID=117547 RepID=A0AAN9YSR8_9PEZI